LPKRPWLRYEYLPVFYGPLLGVLAPSLGLADVVALLPGEDKPQGAQQPLGRGGHLHPALSQCQAVKIRKKWFSGTITILQMISQLLGAQQPLGRGGHLHPALSQCQAVKKNWFSGASAILQMISQLTTGSAAASGPWRPSAPGSQSVPGCKNKKTTSAILQMISQLR
jgi:hypothetical protein